MMTLSELKNRKRELGLTNKDVAEASGVPLSTVQKVFGGTTEAPRRHTLEILSATLAEDAYIDNLVNGRIMDRDGSSVLSDIGFSYNPAAPDRKQGQYTIEDMENLPEGRMAELIDGEIYDMCFPRIPHQLITFEIACQIRECIERERSECAVYISPVGVRIDRDDKTLIGPDLFVACEKSYFKDKYYDGAPDFVLETLSPSTASKDRIIKLNKYWQAGCREYWIVDIDKQTIDVNIFKDEIETDHYTFDEIVPVGISEGKCAVDFRKIKEKL